LQSAEQGFLGSRRFKCHLTPATPSSAPARGADRLPASRYRHHNTPASPARMTAPPVRFTLTAMLEPRRTAPMQKHIEEPVTALDLGPDAEPTAQIAAYFAKCREKLGFVPNVLRAYAFDNTKLQAFIDMVDDLMLGD